LHEPLLLNAVEDDAVVVFNRMREAAELAIASRGPQAGVDAFVAMATGNACWQQSVGPELSERMLNNGEVLFGMDRPSFWSYRAAEAALAASQTPVKVLLGRETTLPFMAEICDWLGTLVHTEVRVVPGGHGAYFDRPEEFSAVLRTLLAEPAAL
jgi:pimeloyl-ACP methyl ester carboxylesterase